MGLWNVIKFDCDIELVIDGNLKEKVLLSKSGCVKSLKVRQSRKQIMVYSILPKTNFGIIFST